MLIEPMLQGLGLSREFLQTFRCLPADFEPFRPVARKVPFRSVVSAPPPAASGAHAAGPEALARAGLLATRDPRTILRRPLPKELAMCYLVREQQPGWEDRGTPLPNGPDRARPRWAAALAMTLVGGLALAALVVPKSAPPEAGIVQQAGAPAAPVAAKASTVPAGTVIEQTAAGMDDGVPATEMKTAASPCHHGL